MHDDRAGGNTGVIGIKGHYGKKPITYGYIKFLAALLLIALPVVLFMFSPFFSVKNIELQGNKVCRREDVVNNCGVSVGENIFKVDKKHIIACLKGNFPYIESLKISLKLPGTVVISVVEREAIGAVPYMGSYIMIDGKGNALEVISESNISGTAIIKGIKFDRFELGSVIPVDNPEKLDIAVSVVGLLNKHTFIKEVSTIDVDDIEKIHIAIEGGLVVNIGNRENLDYKMSYLGEILKKMSSERKGYLDFSEGENPVFKPER